MKTRQGSRFLFLLLFAWFPATQPVYAILAGGEFYLPSDSPSGRLDTESLYSFVGALDISAGGFSYRGSAVALSPNWVLSAGHRNFASWPMKPAATTRR